MASLEMALPKVSFGSLIQTNLTKFLANTWLTMALDNDVLDQGPF